MRRKADRIYLFLKVIKGRAKRIGRKEELGGICCGLNWILRGHDCCKLRNQEEQGYAVIYISLLTDLPVF